MSDVVAMPTARDRVLDSQKHSGGAVSITRTELTRAQNQAATQEEWEAFEVMQRQLSEHERAIRAARIKEVLDEEAVRAALERLEKVTGDLEREAKKMVKAGKKLEQAAKVAEKAAGVLAALAPFVAL